MKKLLLIFFIATLAAGNLNAGTDYSVALPRIESKELQKNLTNYQQRKGGVYNLLMDIHEDEKEVVENLKKQIELAIQHLDEDLKNFKGKALNLTSDEGKEVNAWIESELENLEYLRVRLANAVKKVGIQ